MNKYHAKRTYSPLLNMEFASLKEARRAEELRMLEMAGEITDLEFQVKFVLSTKPKITYISDFKYKEHGVTKYEDSKGVLTRDTRTKLAWVKEKYNIDVILS